ncbi:putative late blight resistance protein homolog R1B-23 [Ipomoea triloba]|uniref:putative late blight resistance protein homolog R1B-23 n=1 Tax=Ipomoea triloba TaxID=35885 RepID=UPI00125E77A6|nr:putative late blight resistance protein homolog R1B-23 [Ipomoea triloba]
MACVALTSLMATIKLEFLQPNQRVSLLPDDEKPLKSLLQKLSYMEGFVKKEYKNAVGGAPIRRHLLSKIRDFALKAEDAIEIQLTSILQLQQKAHLSLQEVAKEAEELLKLINLPLIGWSEAAASSHPHNIASSGGSLQCSPQFEDIIMLCGDYFLQLRRDLLLHMLFPERSVLTIVGAPGIGKTTLCKKLYTDNKFVSRFDIQAWITIPPRYNGNVRQLLCHLIQSMRPTLNEAIDMLQGSTVSQLKHQLHKHLKKGKRYFIVLDDVPNTLLWDDIHHCFPDDPNGSLILLTTIFTDVAEYINGNIMSLPYLSDNESWVLFSHRLSLKQHMTCKLEEIAKHLVEECRGLPRSIVTVADLLSKCNYTLKEWKKIEKELLSLGILHRDTQHSSKLTSIFNCLPQHLKVCFLYFVVFPKHIQINVKKLIQLWIAEGFVKPLKCLPLEDIGYMYLRSLRSRGLVRTNDGNDLRPKTCEIHIDMHSFCVREAQKEGLLCAVNTQQCIGWSLDILANSCRWLSLRSHSLDYHVLFSSNIPRSLFIFQGGFERFIPFKHLRILDLSESLILKRVSLLPLRNLVFLRYLSIPQWFESFDDAVSSNSNLQTLTVSGTGESTFGARTLHFLPSKIWELQHLRHLQLGDMYMIDPPNMVIEHLQTLVCAMPIYFRKKEVYCKFPSIRKLKVVYKDILVPGCSGGRCCINPIIILENFEDLLMLETLTVIVPVGSITLLERVGFPTNLEKLRLSGTNFAVKVLTVIGQLPKLKVLKLENAFYGRVWEMVEGGFPELKELEVEAVNLERWVTHTNTHHFPKIEKIFFKRCYSLKDISLLSAIQHPVLSIKLEQCPPSVFTSVKRYNRVLCIIVDGETFWEEEEEEEEGQYTDKEESEEEGYDKEVELDDIQVVKEFSDVFPEHLPRSPPNRESEFEIEVVLRTTPISKALSAWHHLSYLVQLAYQSMLGCERSKAMEKFKEMFDNVLSEGKVFVVATSELKDFVFGRRIFHSLDYDGEFAIPLGEDGNIASLKATFEALTG